MRQNLNKILLHGFVLSMVSAIITLLSLCITNKSLYILSYSPVAVILTFILVLGISLLVYALSNIIIAVFLSFNFFSSLSLASLIKYEMRNIPVILNDFFLLDEINKLNGYVHFSEYIPQLLSILGFNLLFALLFIMTRKRFDRKANRFLRSFGAVLAIVLISSSLYLIETRQLPYDKSGPIHLFAGSIWSTSEYALTDGEAARLDDLLSQEQDIPVQEAPERKPNLIVIMSEAFWDLDQLPGVALSPDPYETFRAIQSESLHGRLEVPVFAGGTSNTEFEILSSISTHMYEEGLMVFNNEIQGPVITLASILRAQGYKSVGLHPFWGWYYNRNQIYSHLGFDNFITSEHLNESELKGYYISDETVTDVILDEIDQTEEPLFLFAVTMQNHGPYDDGRFDGEALDLTISGEALDEMDQLLLDVYGQGVDDAVGALDRLLESLRDSDEETLVLFFGDHLPLLGIDYKVYRDTGFLVESDDYIEKYLKMRTTPFILWSNRSDESRDLGVMDAVFIGPYLLGSQDLEMPDYYRRLLALSRTTAFINTVFLEKEGAYYFSDSQTYQAISDPMVLIQKDLLYGDRRSETDPGKWVVANNSSYNTELRTITIEEAVLTDTGLLITGENLYAKGRLTLDGKAVPFTWRAGQILIAEDDLPDSAAFRIEMTLIDTIEKPLARSNTYLFNR